MFASSQSAGRVPVFRDFWWMRRKAGAIWSAQAFNTWFGILSGPGALPAFRLMRSLATPDVVTFICLMRSAGGLLTGVGVMSVSWVKTDLNCSSRSFVLPELSLTSLPRCFRVRHLYCLASVI